MTDALRLDKPLPVGGAAEKSVGWWGLWLLVVTEGSLFGYLLLSYFYLYFQTEASWPPGGAPELLMPGINTVILLMSSVFVALSERAVRRRRSRRRQCAWMGVAIALGATFIAIQLREWSRKPYTPSTHLYGSLYFIITGFHLAHVLVGLVILLLLLVWLAMGYFSENRHAAVTVGGLYWHFVDAVWLFIFSSLYLVPYATGK
jgi:cytochrome c oxidase subunit 3